MVETEKLDGPQKILNIHFMVEMYFHLYQLKKKIFNSQRNFKELNTEKLQLYFRNIF